MPCFERERNGCSTKRKKKRKKRKVCTNRGMSRGQYFPTYLKLKKRGNGKKEVMGSHFGKKGTTKGGKLTPA